MLLILFRAYSLFVFGMLTSQIVFAEPDTVDVVDSHRRNSVVDNLKAKGALKTKLTGLQVREVRRTAPANVQAADIVDVEGVANGLSRKRNSCVNGNYEVILSPDGEALTIFFNEFIIDPMAENDPYLYLDTRGRRRYTAAKFCHINLDIEIPNGWTFAIHELNVLGFAALEANTRGSYGLNYSFRNVRVRDLTKERIDNFPGGPGGPAVLSSRSSSSSAALSRVSPAREFGRRFHSSTELKIKGPYYDDIMHNADFRLWTFAPCQRRSNQINLSLNSNAVITGASEGVTNSYLAIDLLDSEISEDKVPLMNPSRPIRYGLVWADCKSYKDSIK